MRGATCGRNACVARAQCFRGSEHVPRAALYVGFNVGGFELGIDPDTSNVKSGNNAVVYWGVPDAQAAYTRKLG